MTPKQEAFPRAKEQGKKAVEGGKKLGRGSWQAIKGTILAVGHTLGTGYEAGASKISEFKENEEGISEGKKKEYRTAKKQHSDKAKDHIQKAKSNIKKAGAGAKEAIKGGGKAIAHGVAAGYYVVDAGDKAIGEKIEKEQLKKGKKVGKVSSFFRDNILKLLIAAGATGYGGYGVSKAVKDTPQHKQEIVINDKINSDEDIATYKLTFDENQYFQNPEFFDKNFKVKKDSTYADKGIILIRDAGMTFYVVQDNEFTKEEIRNKLASIPEFSYLKDSVYDDKIKGFNVPDSCLKKGLYIPIPVNAADKKINIDEFKQYSKIALHEMENDTHYGKKIKEIIKKCGEKQIINIMTAFARCETATDQEKFSDPIGTTELHRWEQGSKKRPIKAFSFSYYHILMEKNADGKTPGPGLRARQNLGLTEGQCYHPINAGKLFLGYCFEKMKDPSYFFKIRNLEDAKVKGGKYNGDSSYGEKLWDNIQYIRKK